MRCCWISCAEREEDRREGREIFLLILSDEMWRDGGLGLGSREEDVRCSARADPDSDSFIRRSCRRGSRAGGVRRGTRRTRSDEYFRRVQIPQCESSVVHHPHRHRQLDQIRPQQSFRDSGIRQRSVVAEIERSEVWRLGITRLGGIAEAGILLLLLHRIAVVRQLLLLHLELLILLLLLLVRLRGVDRGRGE